MIIQQYVPELSNSVINSLDLKFWLANTSVRYIKFKVDTLGGRINLILRHINEKHNHILENINIENTHYTSNSFKLDNFKTGFLVPEVHTEYGKNFRVSICADSNAPTHNININYIFCTYKKSTYIQKNAKIFKDFIAEHSHPNIHCHLTIVDNGGDCGVENSSHITVLQNRNNGGTGGFGRGMYETCHGMFQGAGFTHVCLMDDDIYLSKEMFLRNAAAVYFLNQDTYLGAPMCPHNPLENQKLPIFSCIGHSFKNKIPPSDLAIGHNLSVDNFTALAKTPRSPHTQGWWWSCINVNHIKQVGLPFPFFYKMDDVEYSLRLKNAGIKLAVPLSFWVSHDDFNMKYNVMAQYFKFRNRFILLTMLGSLNKAELIAFIKTQTLRAIALRQYELATLLLLAFKDYKAGPDKFIGKEEATLKEVLSVVKDEKYSLMRQVPSEFNILNQQSKFKSASEYRLYKFTLSGHFLRKTNKGSIDIRRKFSIYDIKDCSDIIYWDGISKHGMQVKRNSLRALLLLCKLFFTVITCPPIKFIVKKYLKRKQHYTSPEFWNNYGKVERKPATKNTTIATQRYSQSLLERDTIFINTIRNAHAGRRAFIIGNGPSLRISDLDLLQNEITFAANKIFLAFSQTKWRPTYYSVEDTLVADSCHDQIVYLDGFTKIFPSHMLSFIPRTENHFFVPWRPPYNSSLPERSFSRDLINGICWGSTITYTLIQLAVHMGIKNIYILGLDHKYIEPAKKTGNTLICTGERNHFHPDYRLTGEPWHLPLLERLECSYRYAKKFCDSIGVNIYNASRDTALNVFPKVDFDGVINSRVIYS
ncbi:glycosyltransferase [Desulfovibrio sp. OttesenSCG-928-A18]|nr:glycosyltransferase [Desulfovibrio sp. OttesenSCG-928-A18]